MTRTLRALLLVLSAALLIVSRPAEAQSTITIGDVPVDVTAKSAAAARDQAIAEVQAKAFDRLVKRLVSKPEDQARIHPSQPEIESFVQDFEVQSERVSPVRYIGRYSVRFRAGRVRKYLSDLGIEGLGQIQQVLIVPVWRGASGPVIWGQGNPWRTAWQRGGFGDGAVTLILPNGDRFDTGALSAAQAENGDLGPLDALIQRYHVAGVVVISAQPRDTAKGAASGLDLTATTYDSTGAKGTQPLAVDAASGEQPEKVLERAVATAAGALEDGWKNGTNLVGYIPPPTVEGAFGEEQPDQPGTTAGTLYVVSLPISGIGEWVRLRDRLAGVPGMQRVALDALTRDGAAVTLDFQGDTLALEAALSSSGYVLVQTTPADASGPGYFQLRRADRPSQPRQPQSPQPQSPQPQPFGAQ